MEIIEIIIIIGILCAQGYVSYLAWKQIESLSHFLSSEDSLQMRQVVVESTDSNAEEWYLDTVRVITTTGLVRIFLNHDIKVGDNLTIVNSDNQTKETSIVAIWEDEECLDSAIASQLVEVRLKDEVELGDKLYTTSPVVTASVSVIFLHNKENSSLLRDVIKTINNYLKKNKGGAADFHLIKDIVERHTDSIDEEINHKLPVPIYLGLMGTVMGIIVGLFSLNFQFDPQTNSLNGELFVNSVSGLISGVKLAMICSFIGLLLTTLLSSWRYMGAKSKLEAQKNAFYDFIQTRLLPQMTKDAASTILSLQSNLERFNSSFQENIQGFGAIMDDIHSAFDSQLKLQKQLKKMDLSQVANLNVNVLSELRKSMDEFEKFTQYLNQMNSFVRSTAKLTDSINDQLQRTEAVETIVEAMRDNIQKNQLVMDKLRAFLERVNEQQAVVTAAGEIDSAMAQAIDELKAHTQEQINSIRTYTTEATADLRELVTSERGHLRSLDSLGKLSELGKLVTAIKSMQDDNRAVNTALESKIEQLAHAVTINTKAQRGESGIPSWLKFLCMVLFVVTCSFVIFFGFKLVNNTSPAEQVEMPYDADLQSDVDISNDTTAHVDTAVNKTTKPNYVKEKKN